LARLAGCFTPDPDKVALLPQHVRLRGPEPSRPGPPIEEPMLASSPWRQLSRTPMVRSGIILVLSLAATVSLAWPRPFPATQTPVPNLVAPDLARLQECALVRVIDGDTIVVADNGTSTTIRLIGVDTPEVLDPRKPVQVYGVEAGRFLRNLLVGETVYLEDSEGPSILDKYGRRLCYVYRAPDGLFVNAEIVRQGYGHAYTTYPFKYLEAFRALEQRARDLQKGLWGPEGQVPSEALGTGPSTGTLPPKVADPAPRADPETVTVYITRTGAKYHRAGCRYLSKSMIPIALKEARTRYGPCSVCSPPQ
jgi:micrococcal nuclease